MIKEEIQMKAIAITAIAGLAAAASAGNTINVNFAATASEINVGDTVNWTAVVTADYTDASAYLGGFVGDFVASDSSLGTAGNWVSNFSGNATTPTVNGASVEGINSFNSALLGTDDSGLTMAFSWSVTADAEGLLDYSSSGIWSYFGDDGIFSLPDEYDAQSANITSDRVSIVPAPGALALLGLGGLIAGRRRG